MDGPNHCAIESLLSIFRKELKTLLDCTERFYGEYNSQKIDSFINYIEAYKNFKNISDEQSLVELPHLLRDHAYTWWKLHMNEMKTWNEAVQTFRKHFSRTRPAHVIYMEIFKTLPNKSENIEVFLLKKLDLFAQLPKPQPEENMQIDMIFGMLPAFIQQKVKRNEIKNFAELIDRVKRLNNQGHYDETIVNYTQQITENITPGNGVRVSALSLERRRTIDDLTEKDTIKLPVAAVSEPHIKVRRTEDLMKQIKDEDSAENQHEQAAQQSETIYTPTDVVKTEPEFQIDSELMHQINSIIESCNGEESTNASEDIIENITTNNDKLTLSVQSSNLTQCKAYNNNNIFTSPINSPTVIDSPIAVTTSTTIIESLIPLKKNRLQVRCNFCRYSGHLSDTCFKKKAAKQQHPTTQSEIAIASSISTSNATEVKASLESQTILIPKIVTPMTSASTGYSTLTTNLIPSGGSSKAQVQLASNFKPAIQTALESHSGVGSSESRTPSTAIITTNNRIITISSGSSKGQTNIITKFATPMSSTSESHTTLTARPLPTAEVKSKSTLRLLAPKLTDSGNPAPKCHQCGMVGYYRSICPNCSPIYFYKSCKNNNP